MSESAIVHNFDATVTQERLAAGNGANGAELLVGLYVPNKGVIAVFDVQSRADLYGPDGAYAIFSARNASRALATMNLQETNSNVDDLTEDQLKVLQDWADKYMAKYPVVGILAQ